MPVAHVLEHPTWHLIGWCCSGAVFSGTGSTIEELLARRVITPYFAPYLVAIYGPIMLAMLGIAASLMLLLIFYLRRRYGEEFDLRKQPLRIRILYRLRIPLAILFVIVSIFTLTRSLLASESCHVEIVHPDPRAEVAGRFNVTGSIGNPESCPSVQVWLRDMGKRSHWTLLDEFLVQEDSKQWGSRYIDLDEEKFRGPEVEIRAIGWRASYGPEELSRSPPIGYLERAHAITVRMKD